MRFSPTRPHRCDIELDFALTRSSNRNPACCMEKQDGLRKDAALGLEFPWFTGLRDLVKVLFMGKMAERSKACDSSAWG